MSRIALAVISSSTVSSGGGSEITTPDLTLPDGDDEGNDVTVQAPASTAGGLTLRLLDLSTGATQASGATVVRNSITSPYCTTYPAVSPGRRLWRLVNASDLTAVGPIVECVVRPCPPTLEAPVSGNYVPGDTINFNATIQCAGGDDNTEKVEFWFVPDGETIDDGNGVLRATAFSHTAGNWEATLDTTGLESTANGSLIARRHCAGIDGETSTSDSTEEVAITFGSNEDSILATSGLVLYVDFDDPTKFTETSGAVSAYVNKVSATSVSQATSGQRPAYEATGLNGHGCAHFDAVDDRFIDTEAAVVNALVDNHAYTLFLVVSFDNADANTMMFGAGNSGNASDRTKNWGQFTTGTPGCYRVASRNNAGTTVGNESAGGTCDTNPHVLCWRYDGTTGNGAMRMWIDLVEKTLTNSAAHNTGTNTVNRYALGCRPDSSPDTFGDGRLGAALLCDEALSEGEVTGVISLLLEKFELA